MKPLISVGLLVALLGSIGHVTASELNKDFRLPTDLQRDLRSKPSEVIEFAGVKAKDHVLDLFGGGGYYSSILSQTVGSEGKVVLHNNGAYLRYVGKELEVRFAKGKPDNIDSVVREADELSLGTEAFDVAFFVMGYHDLFFSSPEWQVTADQVIPQVLKSLKPKGRFLIIDHNSEKGTGSSKAQELHRIERDFVISDMEQRGFRLLKTGVMLENPEDPLNISAFDKTLNRNTSRFALLFEKK